MNDELKSNVVEIANVGIEAYEHHMRDVIRKRLGEDWEVLRSLEVKPLVPTSVQEAAELAKTKGILTVRGFLSLNGETGRMLDMNMEMGLTRKQDLEIAEELASQCVVCVRLMKEEHKSKKPAVLH